MNPIRLLSRFLPKAKTSKVISAKKHRVLLNVEQLEERECPSVNLILNPSVEQPGLPASLPAYWQTASLGSNTAAFSYANTGFDGQRSLKVDIKSFSLNASSWQFADVPVVGGGKYTFSDMYTSNVMSSATVRFLLSNGSYTYSGIYLAAQANTPTKFTFNFTAPTNAVAATVLHGILLRGSLTTDAYSLLLTGSTDTAAPTAVTVTGPAANSTVKGTINLTATAADNVRVGGVRFLVDGKPIGSEDFSAPFSMPLNTTTLTNGAHSVVAIARDHAGNTTTSTALNFIVDNAAPTVSVASPLANALVKGTIDLTANAADNLGLAGVRFLVDNVLVGTEDTTGPAYSASLNTASLSNGNHSIVAIARDNAGNTTTSASVSFIVDNSAPTVSVTGPSAGQSVSGTVNLTASAADNRGVVGVSFLVDNLLVGTEDTSADYQIALDTTALSNGSHSVVAIARDAAGNTTTSAPISFTVSNLVNLILNPSVEQSDSSGDPTGWLRGGWGTNAPIFSTVTPGHTGNKALRVEMTQHTDGDRKWYFSPISVSVTANTVYTYTDWYRSNVNSIVTAEFLMADGTLTFADLGTVGARSEWTKTSFQFAAPTNAVSMTIYHLINQVGWLETDDFSLTASAPAAFARPMITLAFDDGWDSQLTNVVPVLQANNLTASFYVISRGNTGAPLELILNPSLETVGTGGGPAKWSQQQNGVNTASFTYANSGSQGSRSAQIDMTSYTSGNAAWYAQDVYVTGGTQYTISHDYKSNVTTNAVARFTLHDGSFVFADLGSALAATGSTYQTQTVTLTAPTNADALTIMHRIGQVGVLNVDNFSIKPVDHGSLDFYMSPAEILSLQALGYEVGNHTMDHVDLTTLSAAGARAALEGANADLRSFGINQISTLAYPYGSQNLDLQAQAQAAGLLGARTVVEGNNTPNSNRYALLHHEVNLTTTVAQVQGWIADAVANNQWLILTFHQVDNSGGAFSTTPEIFQQIATLVTAANADVVTMRDGIARLA